MNLPKIGVKYPVTTAMFFIALVVMGLFSFFQLGVDLMPEIEMPAISVNTSYPGAAPEEIESEITEILERSLARVDDLRDIESVSREGVSSISLRFDWGVNLDEATNDVRDNLDRVRRDLPEDADDPVIFKFDLSMIPIYILGITAEQSLPDLHDIAELDIARQLETVPGVASATVRGGDRRQLNISLHLDKLNAYGIPVASIREAVRASDLALPAGRIKTGKFDYLLRVPERVELEEIKEIIIGRDAGRKVYLKDVADIEFGYEEAENVVSLNGGDGVMMMIHKSSGENTVDVARRVRRELERIENTLPPDVGIYVIRDFSDFIEQTIGSLRTSLIFGGIVVCLVILFLLGNLASAFKVLIVLPTSLIVAFFLLYLGDYTLNIISLSSLAIALGMVVDGAVVVLDNISRKKEDGLELIPAVLEGSDEVAKPVIASALTTVSVFFPVFFVGGIAGIYFRQMAFVIILTLSVSLLGALWLIPMLSSKIERSFTPKWIKEHFIKYGERFLVFLENNYEKLLKKVLKRPKRFLAGITMCFFLGISLFYFVEMRFAPEADSDFFTVRAELPLGTRLDVTEKVVREIERLIEENVPEKETMVTRWGTSGRGGGPGGGREGSHTTWSAVRLTDRLERRRSVFEIVDELRPKAAMIPGARIRFGTEDPLASMLYGQDSALVIELYSHDLTKATLFAEDLEEYLNEQPGISDAQVSRELGRPEIKLGVRRRKADSLGFSVAEIAYTLRTLFEGEDVAEYSYRGENYDINLRLRKEDRSLLEDVSRVFLPMATGHPIKLSELVDFEHVEGPSVIERKNQQRYVTVSANIRDIGIVDAVDIAREGMEKLGLPEDVRYVFGGEFEEQQEVFGLMAWAALLAMLLVYMVMASQFESLVYPFFVLFSIPFAFVGVAIMLLVTGTAFTMDSFLGVIMLVGIVVNNAIVLISYMEQLNEKDPDNIFNVTIQAGKRRLRPILMTTLSTIGAMLPLSIMKGQGAEYWRPFSNAIVGGLSVGFVITLFIIPAIFYLYEKRKKDKLKA